MGTLSENGIIAALKTRGDFSSVVYYESTDSTNACAKRAAAALADGTVIAAARQTAGRGRLGRTFDSGAGGVYLSAVWKPEADIPSPLPLTGMVAVAVRRAIADVTGIDAGIKWMNDLYVGGRKVAGILAEMQTESGASPVIVIGVGINANRSSFSPEVRPIAASLHEFGGEADENELAAAVITALGDVKRDWLCGALAPYLDEYRTSCLTLGREVILTDGRAARAVGIGEDFSLIAEADGVRFSVRQGEATLAFPLSGTP